MRSLLEPAPALEKDGHTETKAESQELSKLAPASPHCARSWWDWWEVAKIQQHYHLIVWEPREDLCCSSEEGRQWHA